MPFINIPAGGSYSGGGSGGTDPNTYVVIGNGGGSGPSGGSGGTGPAGPVGPAGADGLSLVWKGELANAPSSPVTNWCYYNTGDKKVYVYSGGQWLVMVRDGADGAQGPVGPRGFTGDPGATGPQGERGPQGFDGTPGRPINWRGNTPFYPANPSNLDAFYHTQNKKAYIYNGAYSTWDILAQDGAIGPAGPNNIPVGGSIGQVITKTGANDGEVGWAEGFATLYRYLAFSDSEHKIYVLANKQGITATRIGTGTPTVITFDIPENARIISIMHFTEWAVAVTDSKIVYDMGIVDMDNSGDSNRWIPNVNGMKAATIAPYNYTTSSTQLTAAGSGTPTSAPFTNNRQFAIQLNGTSGKFLTKLAF